MRELLILSGGHAALQHASPCLRNEMDESLKVRIFRGSLKRDRGVRLQCRIVEYLLGQRNRRSTDRHNITILIPPHSPFKVRL